MLDDLEHRLGQYEARLREMRRLLLMVKHRQAELPEEILASAARLFALSGEADSLAEELARLLQANSDKRTQALRARHQTTLADETPRASMEPLDPNQAIQQAGVVWAEPDEPDFSSKKFYDGEDDEAAGNASVPAFPKRPVPVLAGGAARRFEESDEPPRNP